MENAARTLTAGDRVTTYEIISLAGVGGMGLVYKALDTKLERVVALKFLPPHLSFSVKDRKRLLHEARSASALDHLNIGVIHGIEGTSDGQTFIVMAFYEGGTLSDRIKAGPMPIVEAVRISRQIARGLAEAHAHDIIHRDVKPSNIMFTGQGVLKIGDFGLALALSDLDATRSLGVHGTPVYMAPEQVQRVPADRRSDIWALGVVLAEMLLGHHPFLRESWTATLFAIQNDPADSLEGVPHELQAIVYKTLAKSPDRRYQSCAELLADLDRFYHQLETAGNRKTLSLGATQCDTTTELKRYIHDAASSQRADANKLRNWRRLSVGIASLAILVALWFSPVKTWIENRLTKAPRHIAVLPFENSGANPLNIAIVEGLMDSLTNKLSNLDRGDEKLWVVPASVVRERNVDKPAAALRDLGATLVVKGGVVRDAQNVRMTVALIDTKSLRQVGSIDIDDPSGDLGSLQDETARRLARLLKINVGAGSLSKDSSVPAAYESYLKALSYIQRYDKSGNLDLAVSELRSAVERDPQFALGFAALGEAYRLKYQQSHDRKWIEEALANCKKAAALDNRLSAVYVTLGRIHNDSGNHDLAIAEFQQALDLDPRNADALNGMAYGYESAGKLAEAEFTYRKAVALRPDSWDGYNTLGLFYNRQRRFDEAVTQLEHAIQLTPDNTEAYNNLAAVYLGSGRPQYLLMAEKALKKSISIDPTYPAYGNLGYLFLEQRRYAESAEMTKKALQLNDKDFLVWENLDWAYRWMGQKDKSSVARAKARELLETAATSNPRDAQVQSHLACQYGREGERDKALIRVQTALALAPDDPDVLAYVSDTYEEIGNHQQALQYAQLSLKKGYSIDDLRREPDMQAVLSDPNFRPQPNQQ